MQTWVVTGPIGAGKSTVTRLLAERGATVIDADRMGHQVLTLPRIVEQVGREFGSHVVRDGQVDRGALGAEVFGDRGAMDRLNALTHPPLVGMIQDRLLELAAGGRCELAVLEAAVYFLWPPQEGIDKVISVVADTEVRRRRLLGKRGLAPELIRRIIQIQNTLEPFWETADVVLRNDGDLLQLREAVAELFVESDGSSAS